MSKGERGKSKGREGLRKTGRGKEGEKGNGRKKLHSFFGIFRLFFFFFFTSRLNSRSEVACLNYLTFVPDCLLHTAIQVDPEEDHEDDQRAGKPLL